MLKFATIALAAILAVTASPLSAQNPSLPSAEHSQPPPQATGPESSGVQKPGGDGQKQGESDQRGTDKSPLVVKVQNTPKPQAEAEQDADYIQRRAAEDRAFKLGVWAIGVGIGQTVALVVTFLIIAFVAVRQLRAYIYPEILGLKKFSFTTPIEVGVKWKNCGQTPAKRFEAHGVVWIAEFPMPDEMRFEKTGREPADIGRHSKPTIYPGEESLADYASLQIPLTTEILDSIIAKKLAIYLAGEAFYRDVFGRRRKTQFCRYIAPEDAIQLIEAERKNTALENFEVKFVVAHMLNDFT
ncbi:MAG: hypothetical protein ACHQRJ_05770 [Alphaproteobacteria bacterium]